MQLSPIVNKLNKSNLIHELVERSRRDKPLTLTGTSRLANSLIITSLARQSNSTLLLVVPSVEEVGRLYPLLELFGWNKTFIYPTSESSPYNTLPTSNEILWGQLQVLGELINSEAKNNLCIITTVKSLQPHLPPFDYFKQNSLHLIKGNEYNLSSLSTILSELGYKRENTINQEGTWSRRGDILDLYPVNSEYPIRLEFFGDILEKLKEFDPVTQRSSDNVNDVLITPTSIDYLILKKFTENKKELLEPYKNTEFYNSINEEVLPIDIKKYLSLAWNEPFSLADYLPENTFVAIEDRDQCIAHGDNWESHVKDEFRAIQDSTSNIMDLNLPYFIKSTKTSIDELNKKFNALHLNSISNSIQGTNALNISNKYIDIQPNQFGKLSQLLKNYLSDKITVFLISAQPSRAVALLQEHECPAEFILNHKDQTAISSLISNNIPVALKCSSEAQIEGVFLPSFKIAILTDKEFFGQQSLINNSYIRRRKKAISKTIDPNKLLPGDYVVHRNHGIGLFIKMEKNSIGGESRDYLVLKYLDGILRVAADQLGSLGRYRSSSEKKPKINKLGGNTWINVKERVRKSLKKVAVDLIKLYAQRDQQIGYKYPPDGPWQIELEDSFPYQATKDQLTAVVDVKRDMEKERPMDRLVCGDVGFGKTEVAIRAIFKAITSGKQIALLAPTTILAQQHWRTLSDRFAPYPIKVSLLNRYKTSSEKQTILEGLDNGTIDAIVGTHLLLNKKVKFSKLGLLVIDEEQRFGVNQKERIKSLKTSVDVLTLSATPIPRTLYMSLSGVREMSLISTPPPLRRSIKTNLSFMDEEIIRSAIIQEMDRGGQIFYVVPRIHGIEEVANKLKIMIPSLKLIIAHGQMSEGELENSMVAFYNGEADLMLCTTIVESGLDIPRVNTILIEDSHKFGLAQLYQLRGRVGRSGIQAYAWLFYPNNLKLSDSAKQRLKAIQEFSSLGSGYQLSMRDMEIRGVGNLLGVEQSGQMDIIGFDMYMELLKEELAEIQGQNIPNVQETQVDLKITAFIPGNYIINSQEKIEAYKEASECKDTRELLTLASSWIDRYGPVPKAVETLIEIMKLKLKAKRCGFTRIRSVQQNIELETLMDEPAFRLLRKGLPKHLHSRIIYKKEDKLSKVIFRGLGLINNDKMIEQLLSWLDLMINQIVE